MKSVFEVLAAWSVSLYELALIGGAGSRADGRESTAVSAVFL